MRPARILVSCVALVSLVSCADDDGSGPQGGGDIEGITWILDPASAAGLADADPGDARATIRFDDGQIGGSAFCNMYGGTYELGDDAMSIGVGAMTEMACEEPVMSLETAFIAALGDVTGYAIGDDTLDLTRDSGAALSFSAQQPLPLEETVWRLDGIATGTDAVSSTLAGTEATATFTEGGTVGGNGSCNDYGGSYTVDGDAIEISEVASTMMACEPDVMDQEAAFVDGLARAATYRIEGSTLTLYDADGAFLLSFVGPPS